MSYEHLTKKIDRQTNDMEALYDVIKPYIDEVEQMPDHKLKACIHEQAEQVAASFCGNSINQNYNKRTAGIQPRFRGRGNRKRSMVTMKKC
ncbi:hypothetical protein [Lentibacillus sp. CBA3610]|uniref:hypothetical protein n=1 Tax=Lentibacillus sp. CBA3610 TaxID=2518176 RepID=UPI00159560DF|nr:hypothetical protein [Lentibacillus sp. CBA3610]QKY68435.1 hypothetical protein Len3610_01285 [Lentibacillus sp. CBA3610]